MNETKYRPELTAISKKITNLELGRLRFSQLKKDGVINQEFYFYGHEFTVLELLQLIKHYESVGYIVDNTMSHFSWDFDADNRAYILIDLYIRPP